MCGSPLSSRAAAPPTRSTIGLGKRPNELQGPTPAKPVLATKVRIRGGGVAVSLERWPFLEFVVLLKGLLFVVIAGVVCGV